MAISWKQTKTQRHCTTFTEIVHSSSAFTGISNSWKPLYLSQWNPGHRFREKLEQNWRIPELCSSSVDFFLSLMFFVLLLIQSVLVLVTRVSLLWWFSHLSWECFSHPIFCNCADLAFFPLMMGIFPLTLLVFSSDKQGKLVGRQVWFHLKL